MGKVYKRKTRKGYSPFWWISYAGPNGKTIRRSSNSTHRASAVKFLRKMESDILAEKFGFTEPKRDSSIERLFKAYLAHHKANSRPKTARRYRNAIDNFRLFLRVQHPGIRQVSGLKPEIIESYREFRRTVDPRDLDIDVYGNSRTGSERTIAYEVKTLKSIFRFGLDRDMIKSNPADKIKTARPANAKSFRYLSTDEMTRFLESAGVWQPIFCTFLNTGMRLGELINLSWGDVDFKNGLIIIQAKPDWRPKTNQMRSIPMNRTMVQILHDLRPARPHNADLVYVCPIDTQFNKAGSKLREKHLRNQLVRIANLAGIEDFTRIHDLRHTFASHLVMKGVDLATVQKLLGHTDIQTTMIYAHLAPDHLRGAVDKLDVD